MNLLAPIDTLAPDVALWLRSFRGAVDRPGGAVARDLDLLVPAFRKRIEDVVADLIVAGHRPKVWETYRSPERAAILARRGTGIVMSMHCYGVAADIIHAEQLWKAPPRFWRALRDAAESHGLVSGARWRRVDLPHVQAVPVAMQDKIRASTAEEVANICAELLP